MSHDPHAVLKSYVEKYGKRLGLPAYDPNPSDLKATPELGIRAGHAFAQMKHDPTDPAVVAAYDALKKELLLQHKHITDSGAKIEPWTGEGQPYKNSKEMQADVRDRGHLWYFPTTEGFGSDAQFNDHPLFENVPDMPGVKYNDLLRGVHDYFAHSIHGHQFGPQGEIRAWHEHAKTLSPLARKALTTETHGQNSWVNFGPHKPWEKPLTERPFADQKAGLLPEDVWPDVPEIKRGDKEKLSRPVEWRKAGHAWWIAPDGAIHTLGANQTHSDWLVANKAEAEKQAPGLSTIREEEKPGASDKNYKFAAYAMRHKWIRALKDGEQLLLHNPTTHALEPEQAKSVRALGEKLGSSAARFLGPDNAERTIKLARVKVPAGGQITGGGLATGGQATGQSSGGQFASKAHARIRETVLAWLRKKVGSKTVEKLAARPFFRRPSKGASGPLPVEDLKYDNPGIDLTPAGKEKHATVPSFDDAVHKAKTSTAQDAAGGNPHVAATPEQLRSKLTIRELKDVEDSLKLPGHLRLSTNAENGNKVDAEHVGNLSLDEYYDWANKVARHMQKEGLTKTATDRLRDPKHLSKAKLAFLVDRLSREAGNAKEAFADTGGAKKWYGDMVGAMSRHLHDSFHNGKPEDDELWGKLDHKTGRVHGGSALTLAKLLVAGTSGGLKPHQNYDVAHRMISAGRKAGTGSVNPFKSIPDAQHESHAVWVDAMAKWHESHKTGVDREQILHPGVGLRDRVKWYEKVIRPLMTSRDPAAKGLVGGSSEKNQRYSGVVAKYTTDPDQKEHYLQPIAIDKGKSGWKSPYDSTAEKPKYGRLAGDSELRVTPPASGYPDYSATLDTLHSKRGSQRRAKLPATDSEGRLKPPGWTSRNEQVMSSVRKINAVIQHFTEKTGSEREGLKAAAKFMLTPQNEATFHEVAASAAKRDPEISKDLKDSSADNRGFYYPGEDLPGAFLLGPKFGAFSMNLHLDQPPGDLTPAEHSKHFGGHLTADLWWSRDWNTMLGTLFGPKNKDTRRQETPRESSDPAKHPERKLMRKAAQLAAERAGLGNVAELQAVLWYYEQQKPKWFGVNTSSTSYLDGVNQVAARSGRKYKTDHLGNIWHESVKPTVGEDALDDSDETDS